MPAANPEVAFRLNGFINECSEMLEEHFQKHFPRLQVPAVKYSEGGKYFRVFQEDRQQIVWFFVDKEEGNIWKPAGWKAPAKNFPRGNILQDNAKDVLCVYGF